MPGLEDFGFEPGIFQFDIINAQSYVRGRRLLA
jgi:hypothetical protein